MPADHVLASIDGALRDCGTSTDAMRWNPSLEETRSGSGPASLEDVIDVQALHHIGEFAQHVTVSFQQMATTVGQILQPVVARFATQGHKLTVVLMDPAFRRKHRRRCHICNPRSWTAPCPVDGREYHRRQRARKRRARH